MTSLQAESFTKQDFIYSALLRRITSGTISIGGRFPAEPDLAAEFQCSRGTVGRAIMRLVQEGLVERKPRDGTRVIRSKAAPASSSLDLDACAFIHPSDQHEGVWRTLRGFQQAAHAAKRRTLMLSAGTDFHKEAEIVGRLDEFNVKGAVLFPVITNPTEMAYYSQMILSCPFPVVLVELSLPGMGRPCVVVDGLHAGWTMTRHLLDRGLRRIGFVANYAWAPFVRDRYLGYRQAMEEAGIPVDDSCVMLESVVTPDFQNPVEEASRIAGSYLEKSGEKIEGIVCAFDFMALAMLEESKRRNLHLAVTGIDDYDIATASKPSLTTYRVPYETLGAKAFELLNQQMSGGTAHPLEIQVRGECIVRESA